MWTLFLRPVIKETRTKPDASWLAHDSCRTIWGSLVRMGVEDQEQDGEKILWSLVFTRAHGPEALVSIVT